MATRGKRVSIPAAILAAIVLLALAAELYALLASNGGAVIINGTKYRIGPSSEYAAGQTVSNFLISQINAGNVTGLSYVLYPLARMNGTPRTLHVGDLVGYSCDGSLKELTSIDTSSGTATFANLSSGKSRYGCPI